MLIAAERTEELCAVCLPGLICGPRKVVRRAIVPLKLVAVVEADGVVRLVLSLVVRVGHGRE
jgi:hypothetical protein